MLHLRFIRHHIKKIVVLTLAGLVSWLILAGLPASAKGPEGVRQKTEARHAAQDSRLDVGVNAYRQTNLVSDIAGVGQLTDPDLINPWGLTQSATSPFWASNEATGTSTLYGGDVGGSPISKVPLRVTIPGGLNTGVVFNGSSDFQIVDPCITPPCPTAPARFIFASLSGRISGWKAGGTSARLMNELPGHVYTGLAIGNNGTANFLYAADFANAKIDVFDKNFQLTTLAGTFTDPLLPAGYAPFNIQNIGGKLYVAYAKVDPATHKDQPGVGNGVVDVYDTNGNFQMRLVTGGPLNSPWGMTISPASFGLFSNALLVGNFGDGRIDAFEPNTGAFLGTLNDEGGHPIEIDELWALQFGNGVGGGDPNSLYFTSGLGEEAHGIFGKLQATSVATSQIQFSSATYTATESSSTLITVTRTGDLSQPATVNYATFDENEDNSAKQSNDYIQTSGTLHFAPGESSKTFPVLITDDVYPEGDETVQLILSNPTGAALTAPNMAELTIQDNDSPNFTVPIPRVFVATLRGSDEVPPKVTDAKGLGIVILSDNEQTAQVSLYFTGLTSFATGAHIHGPAAPGANAPILFPLTVPAATSGGVNNVTINLTSAQVDQLKSGQLYMNVHSQNNPGGEIRGQILFNPIDESAYFVRQQYRDFLNREPESGGLVFWLNQINLVCGTDARCISRRRVDVSAAFFLSAEFQQTGFFVYRVRRATLGSQPTYSQYLFDRNQLGSGSDADKRAFTEAFVQRPEFLSVYPTTQTGSEFIDKLINTIKSATGVDLTSKKPELANEYIMESTQAASRARVIRKVIEYTEFVNAEFNRAFVLAQYFEYLRRDPDIGGFQFWLNVLNNNVPGNYRSMVCAFLTSAEYQLRFGPTVTRSNIECDPAIIGP